MTGVSQRLTYNLRNDLAKKINKLPMSYFDKKTKGEVLSIVTNDIDTVSQNLNQSITQIITAICTLIGIWWSHNSKSLWRRRKSLRRI